MHTIQHLDDVFVQFQAEQEGARISNTYSGRGMFGRQCFAVQLDRGLSVLQYIGQLMQYISEDAQDALAENEQMGELAEMLQDAQTDNLGLGIVLYFPHYIMDPSTFLDSDDMNRISQEND